MSIEKLLSTNVNEHTEKKGRLTYLSWAWAWAEALRLDETASFKVEMFDGKCYMEINGTLMVWVTVSMFGKPMTCQLPVMDNQNEAIPLVGKTIINKYGKEVRVECDSFAVNTAIMRCMTKALSLHGLGLYIYAGEDLPIEGTDTSYEDANLPAMREAAMNGETALKAAFDKLPENGKVPFWKTHQKELKAAAAAAESIVAQLGSQA